MIFWAKNNKKRESKHAYPKKKTKNRNAARRRADYHGTSSYGKFEKDKYRKQSLAGVLGTVELFLLYP